MSEKTKPILQSPTAHVRARTSATLVDKCKTIVFHEIPISTCWRLLEPLHKQQTSSDANAKLPKHNGNTCAREAPFQYSQTQHLMQYNVTQTHQRELPIHCAAAIRTPAKKRANHVRIYPPRNQHWTMPGVHSTAREPCARMLVSTKSDKVALCVVHPKQQTQKRKQRAKERKHEPSREYDNSACGIVVQISSLS